MTDHPVVAQRDSCRPGIPLRQTTSTEGGRRNLSWPASRRPAGGTWTQRPRWRTLPMRGWSGLSGGGCRVQDELTAWRRFTRRTGAGGLRSWSSTTSQAGSWLNMAEIEFRGLTSRKLRGEVQALVASRTRPATISWRFHPYAALSRGNACVQRQSGCDPTPWYSSDVGPHRALCQGRREGVPLRRRNRVPPAR